MFHKPWWVVGLWIEIISLITALIFIFLRNPSLSFKEIPLIIFILFVPYGTTSLILGKLIRTTKNVFINGVVIVMSVLHIFIVSLGIMLFSGI